MVLFSFLISHQQPQQQEGDDAEGIADDKNEVGSPQQGVFHVQYLCLVVNVGDHVLIDLPGRLQHLFHFAYILFQRHLPDILKEEEATFLFVVVFFK